MVEKHTHQWRWQVARVSPAEQPRSGNTRRSHAPPRTSPACAARARHERRCPPSASAPPPPSGAQHAPAAARWGKTTPLDISLIAYYTIHCEIIYIRWTFNFVYFVVGRSTNLRSKRIQIHFSNIAYNLTSTNSCVHEHVQCCPTMKLGLTKLNEIKACMTVPGTRRPLQLYFSL